MTVLKSGEHIVNFDENGSEGTPVVFIHGSGGAAAQWKRLAQKVSEEFHTFSIDLPGCGRNEPWKKGVQWSRDVDTRAIDTLFAHVGDRAHVVAHSAAGNLSYESLLRNRDQLISLTLFEPTYFQFLRHNASPQFSQPDEMARTFQRFMDAGDVDGAMQSFVDVWAKSPGAWAALPEAVRGAMRLSANRLYFEWDLIYVDFPTLADLEALGKRLLLFKGSDTIDSMHEVCRLLTSKLPRCEFFEVEGAGHMSPFTHADVVAPEVRRFLAAQH